MKRYIVNLAALLLGLVLGGVATYASAESMPATQQTAPSQWRATNQQPWSSSAQSACDIAWPSDATTANIIDWSAASCKRSNGITQGYVYAGCPDGGSLNATGCVGAYVYTCPSAQNWTLSGTNCTRPDCVAPSVRQSDGTCSNPCPASNTYDWYSSPRGADITGTYCTNGCSVTISLDLGTSEFFESSSTIWRRMSRSVTGEQCSSGAASPAGASSNPPNTPNNSPPCAPSEGVVASSSSGVKCVSQSVNPGADKPIVNKKTSVETHPDGSTKTTTNIQTCTGLGACSTTTTVTVGAATAGGAGSAGTPGVVTTGTDKPKTETSDFCAQNPSLQMCKGGMNEEATQKEVRDEIKKLTTPNVSDDSAITGATHSQESQTAFEAENLKVEQAATGIVDPTSASKSSWLSAMESGWFAGIPQSSCTPFVSNFSGKTWTFDVCPTAAKISEWGAWAFAFMAAFMIWGMFTQQKET